jgi:hypothetical protein
MTDSGFLTTIHQLPRLFNIIQILDMALGLTQPLTEMSTRNISWGKGSRCVELTTLPPSCVDRLEIW